MRALAWLLLCLLPCWGLATSALAAPALATEPIVILLSWDGVRHDFPDRASVPALERMQREGARAGRLTPVFPPNTFPSHVSLATGARVDVHGIVGNRFTDAERGRFRYSNDASWIRAEPIWVSAERQGVRSAAFFWVGSETDWNGQGASYRRAPFDGEIPETEKVDQIVAWLDLPESERPRLILSWWHGTDHVAHAKGPDHADVAAQLIEQDEQLGRLLAAIDERDLWTRTTLIVVSDHGMTAARRTVEVEDMLAAEGIEARLEAGGGIGFVHLADRAQLAAAVALLDREDGVTAVDADRVPGSWHIKTPDRTGDLVVLAEAPRTFSRVTGLRGWRRAFRWFTGGLAGMHGYRPDHPDMGAIFYAMGRGIPSDWQPTEVRAIDVAPSVAALLRIDAPRDAEGRSVLPEPVPPAVNSAGVQH